MTSSRILEPPKLLIFDLDETLVHASQALLAQAPDFEVAPYFVHVRPFVPELLAQLAPHYDFAVWSSSSRGYVDRVCTELFGDRFALKFAWAVERCIQRVDVRSNGYVYIKDLRKVARHGYQLEQIVMLDDSPEKISRQPRNHLRLAPYLGAQDDRELLRIAQMLMPR